MCTNFGWKIRIVRAFGAGETTDTSRHEQTRAKAQVMSINHDVLCIVLYNKARLPQAQAKGQHDISSKNFYQESGLGAVRLLRRCQ